MWDTCPTYLEKFVRDDVISPILLLSVVSVPQLCVKKNSKAKARRITNGNYHFYCSHGMTPSLAKYRHSTAEDNGIRQMVLTVSDVKRLQVQVIQTQQGQCILTAKYIKQCEVLLTVCVLHKIQVCQVYIY